MKDIDSYQVSQCINEREGLQHIITLLRSVYSDADYVGNFFHKLSSQKWSLSYMKDEVCTLYPFEILTMNEAVDKMVSMFRL